MAVLAAIERNLQSGLMPTTGGAVSLMPKSHVDMLYDRNQGTDAKFVPLVPDTGGHPAVGRHEWYVAAIEQALLYGDRPFEPKLVEEMDELLSGYWGSGIDWMRVHSYAVDRDSSVRPWRNALCWTSESEPRTILAFCGEEGSVTPDYPLQPLRIERARVTQISLTAGRLEDRLSMVENQNRRVGKATVATLVAIAALVAVGFGTAQHWTKVDVPEQKETFHSEEYETGSYYVLDDGKNPCYIGQDWTDCTNLMIAEYNWACTSGSRIPSYFGGDACEEYSANIDRMQSVGGYGYTVSTLGGYGHLTKEPEVDTRQISNNDYRPAVSHDAICYLGFIGECE